MGGFKKYLIISFFIFSIIGFANKRNLFTADSLFKSHKYLKAYSLYQKLDTLQNNTQIPLYNLSVLLDYKKDAFLLAQKLYKNDKNTINLQRLVYSSALNNISFVKINKLIAGSTVQKKYLNFLAGSGYLDGYNLISSYDWFNSFNDDNNVQNLKYWQKQSALLSGLNKFNLSSNFMYFKYNDSKYDYGTWYDIELSTAYKRNKLGFIFASEKVLNKEDTTTTYTDINYTDYYKNYYTYTYNNKYFLTANDSMLLDTTEVYHYLFKDTLNYITRVKKDSKSKNKVDFQKFEYASTYNYLFSDRFHLSLVGKYVDIKQSLFKNIISGGIGVYLNLGHLSWYGQINYEQINRQDYFPKTIFKNDSSIITENYTKIDTTTYINEFGNEEQKISSYDTTAVKKYYTNYNYIDYDFKKNNYDFLYYHNKFIYSNINFMFSIDNYLGKINNRKLGSNQFHNFTKFSLALYPSKSISLFGSCFTGEKFLFNTDNYSSLNLSEESNSSGYSIGFDYFVRNISTNFYLKYQEEFFHDYHIESLLIGLIFKL